MKSYFFERISRTVYNIRIISYVLIIRKYVEDTVEMIRNIAKMNVNMEIVIER